MNSKAAQDTRSEAQVAARLSHIRIVLINTSHPGNIGATARAMKVMGLANLHLVNPKTFPCHEATAMASGADDLLQRAVVHETLESALDGCGMVMGTSARLRSLPMPQMDLRSAAKSALEESQEQDIAILFGQERAGLTNDEIHRCHQLVHVDTDPNYGSLNLSQAVQLMAYELRMAVVGGGGAVVAPSDWVPVDAGQMEMFFVHLEQTLLDIGFMNPDQPKRLMARMRRLFNRARPDQNEINILRGILAASQYSAGKRDS
ncbi:MAG: TrmJ/YjtD family RNA methyltransferase [Lysobacterales bacterium]